jgi:hypothetical protein
MKARSAGLVFFLLLVLVLTARLAAQTEIAAEDKTHGYFSMSFLKGQKGGEYSRGSFGEVGAGILFSGHFTPQLQFRLEIRSRSEARFELEEALLDLEISKALNVHLGMHLVPFGRFNRRNRPQEQKLVRVPLVVEAAYPASWRDIGLMVSGQLSFLNYAASLGNGLGQGSDQEPAQQFTDNNAAKGLTGRLGLRWSKEVETAFSYSRQAFDREGRRTARLWAADGAWNTDNYELAGEYIILEYERPADIGGSMKTEGWYVELAFNYQTLWPVVSYQRLSLTPAAVEEADRKSRWAVGLLWLLRPGILFKAEYDWNREPGHEIKDDLFSFQVAVSF